MSRPWIRYFATYLTTTLIVIGAIYLIIWALFPEVKPDTTAESLLIQFALFNLAIFIVAVGLGGSIWGLLGKKEKWFAAYPGSTVERYLAAGSSILPPMLAGFYLGAVFGHPYLAAVGFILCVGAILSFLFSRTTAKYNQALQDDSQE